MKAVAQPSPQTDFKAGKTADLYKCEGEAKRTFVILPKKKALTLL